MPRYTPSQAHESAYDGLCIQLLSIYRQVGRHFSIICDMQKATFDPPLSMENMRQFGSMSHFIISGATFESFELYKDPLERYWAQFLVGLGASGESVRVRVRISGIYQIILHIQGREIATFTRIDSAAVFGEASGIPKDARAKEADFSDDEKESLRAILSSTHNRNVFENLKPKP
ncbi:hypothetical protein BKN38_03595 [Helicobacter sp. CLO-3]|uniref:hypothetical protein n=1 Tax=unclassified Helicobacter TaxID=2593540 RepID=UPI000805E2FB|nr:MULTISPECIES: hypothetical protein [unclassified Helicobacter]OBV28870.1 hypothetical protein BA723_07745 [Helicobacter sp. CLO-3]OHU84124.1 hypothetical protein BKN38_03595 [Helicobacter sp. CLO-3]